MPPRHILSPQSRTALFDPPTDQAAIVRHYTLSPEDMALIRDRRRAANRLGFAVHLAYLGLMHHESSIDIREHYTDTAGAIDHVFGLCHLLGFRYAPRVRDLADRRLYIVGARGAYKALDSVMGGALDLRVVGENWDEVLRLASSIKAGTVAPSAILRRLAAYPRQNALAKAIKEIGRLERTFYARLYQRPRLAAADERRTQQG